MDIKKNNIYTVEITGMTHDGKGVAKIENYSVFVENAIIGEQVELKLVKENKSYGYGKMIQIIKQSEKRIQPFCNVFNRCGGCSLQHMDYKAQLEFKTEVVKEALKRIGGIEDIVVHDILGMQCNKKYRNKAQYPVSINNKTVIIGFYAKRSHDIVDSVICGIQNKASDDVRAVVRQYIQDNMDLYNEYGDNFIKHVMVRTGHTSGEIMVAIIINRDDIPDKEKLIESLVTKIPQIKSIIFNINKKNNKVILGKKNIKIYGKETIRDNIGRFQFDISPLSFFQVNPVQTEVLYSKVLEYAALNGNETVFDLYCGIGAISLFLSDKAKKVYGIEIVEDAVKDAIQNAKLNNVENVEFTAGQVEEVVPYLYKKGIKADVVVVDPPRKGCNQILLNTLVDMQPARIIYVSCNPSTLARDLKYLDENGYKAIEAQPVDMFPHTSHVECVVRIQCKKCL